MGALVGGVITGNNNMLKNNSINSAYDKCSRDIIHLPLASLSPTSRRAGELISLQMIHAR